MNIFSFDAYLFDMDGVLADTNPQHKMAFQQFLGTKGIDCTDAFFNEHIVGNSNEGIVKKIMGEEATPSLIRAWADEKEALFRSIYKPYMKPMPGVVNFLDKLYDLGKKIAVCTSAPIENLNFLLDGLGIRRYFSVTLCENDVTAHKPDPAVYLKALDMLGAQSSNAIVFEDTSKGASAGIAAGCQVIIINNTHLQGDAYLDNQLNFQKWGNKEEVI